MKKNTNPNQANLKQYHPVNAPATESTHQPVSPSKHEARWVRWLRYLGIRP